MRSVRRVFPGGGGNTDDQVGAIAQLRPESATRATPDPEKSARAAESRGKESVLARGALVSGAAPPPSLPSGA